MKHRFSVWAPKRKKVTVLVEGTPYPMLGPDEHGRWTADVDLPKPQVDYAFLVDEETHPYPDPRSEWQPNGVHAASRTYHHADFVWSDRGFRAVPLSGAVLYEMHVGTFTQEGTFDAAIGCLDHLVQLGVTHVEVLPIAAFEGEHGWGYDGVALFAPQQSYGGPDGFKRLVNACHERGLAVLLDVVYNHFGPTGNYTGIFGPYINHKHTTPWGGAMNFEAAGADQVRRFCVDNMLHWMQHYHVDGLRLDAVHEFIDRSALHILEQMTTETETLAATLGKPLVLIAESDLNDPRLITSREAHGFGLDAQWSDDFHHALHAVLTGEQAGYYEDFGSMEKLGKALEHVFVFSGEYSSHRLRAHGRPVSDLSFHHFLGYIQNHDQIGNRAQGDRISHLVSFKRAQIAAALVLTSAFVPMIFQGEEWAASSPFQFFADHQDPQLRKNVSKGRRNEFASFGWKPEDVPDPESREAFVVSKLRWDEVTEPPHDVMLAWYRDLIALRKSTPELLRGEPEATKVTVQEEQKTLVMRRGSIRICVNLGNTEQSFPAGEGARVLLASQTAQPVDGTLILAPDSVAILATS